MTLPTWVAAGTVASGTGNISPGLPTGWIAGDDLYLFVETGDQVVNPPTGLWRRLGFVNVSSAVRLTAFTKRAVTGETAPTVVDAGDHTHGVIIGVRGGHGYPHLIVEDSGTLVGAGQVQSMDGGTTTENDCFIIIATAHDIDDATASYSGLTNTNLTNLTERVDVGTTQGNGGGIGVFTGELATAGAIGTTDVTNARTNPNWVSMILAIMPTWAPNDNFVDREIITVPDPEAPVLQEYIGSTFDASTEASEPLTWATARTLDRTEWWEYESEIRRIVKVRLESDLDPEGFAGQAVSVFKRMPEGGTGADDVLPYATAPVSFPAAGAFGEDEGRGVSTAGLSSVVPSITTYARVQVAPDDPLYFQVGRQNWSAFADATYTLEFTAFVPPANDDIENSLLLSDEIGGIETFDLMGATGQPGFKSLALPSHNIVTQGEIFYKLIPGETKIVSLKIEKDDIADDARDISAYVFQGDSFGGMQFLLQVQGANTGSDSIASELLLEAGQTYTVAIVLNNFQFASTLTTASLEWSYPDPPPNDNFADAEIISGDSGSTLVASLIGSTGEENEPTPAKSVWYEFTPTTGGWYEFEFGATGPISFSLTAYRGTAMVDLARVDTGAFFNTTVTTLALRGGETYMLQLGLNGVRTLDLVSLTWNLLVSPQDVADDFADRYVITGTNGTQAADMEGATNETDEEPGRYWNQNATSSIWFEWQCPATGWYTFWTENLGSTLPTDISSSDMSVWHDDPFVNDMKIAGNSNGRLDSQQQIAFFATFGETYYIQTDSYRDFNTADWQTPYEFNLHWDQFTPEGNETFLTAEEIMAGEGAANSVSRNNFGHSTDEVTEPDMQFLFRDEVGEDSGYFARPAWFKLTPDRTGSHTFSFEAPGTEIFIHFFEGTTLENLTAMIPTDDSEWSTGFGTAGAGASYESDPVNIQVELVSGQIYYLLICGLSWDDAEDAETFYPGLWSPGEVSQGAFDISFAFAPAENDDINSQSSVFAENLGNLSFWSIYAYGGEEYFNQVLGPGVGGCRITSNFGATAEASEPAHAGFTATRSLWFQLQPAADGDYKIWVESAGTEPVVDPVLAVYDWSSTIGGLGVALASDDDTNGLFPEVTLTLNGFSRYLIAVDARDEGEFRLHWQKQPVGTPPANDAFADAISVAPGIPVSGTTVDSTVECGEQSSAGFVGGPFGSVWYKYVAPVTTSGLFALTTTGLINDYVYVDIFEGTTLDSLVNITNPDNFWHGSLGDTVNVPFNMISGNTYYFRLSSAGDDQWPFDFELLEQSSTPPDNDDSENAEDAPSAGGSGGSNTFPGTTDGSGFESGEVDPNGGLLEETAPSGGSVWHTYEPAAPGFIAVYTTRGVAESEWYRVGVWEGENKTSSLKVTTSWNVAGEPGPAFYEVRAGQKYWIQIIREPTQTWGDYDLHINEYLEVLDWELGTDDFTTEHNSVLINGGTMTCSGRQSGIGTEREILPQYGTLDTGANTRKWSREIRIGFDLKVVAGQILYRSGATDNWSFANAFSDNHETLFMNRVGLVRLRDVDGEGVMALTFTASGVPGENILELRSGDTIRPYPISLGNGGPQHDSGIIRIELVVSYFNSQSYDDSSSPITSFWVYVDGKPQFHTTNTTGTVPNITTTKKIRYYDIGMWRHPTQSTTNDANNEDPEIWSYEMSNIRVTDIVPQDPLDIQLKGDLGITEFDGFTSKAAWKNDTYVNGSPARHTASVSSGTFASTLTDFPGKTWGAFRSQSPGIRTSINYSAQTGSRRFYCFSINAAAFPTSAVTIAAYESILAKLTLDSVGELRIAPFGGSFCVAHLELNEHYFIEVHIDAEVVWDVKCTIFINGQSFGTFTNAVSWAEVGTGLTGFTGLPGFFQAYDNITIGTYAPSGSNPQDIYFTNLIVGRCNPEDAIGPLQCVNSAAIQSAGIGHNIPDWPSDPATYMDLLVDDGGNHSKLYNWEDEDNDLGPIVVTWTGSPVSGDHSRYFVLPSVPHSYHPYFVLMPTYAWEEENVGIDNDWSPLGEGLTRIGDGGGVSALADSNILHLFKFGQSVPVADTITGIEVKIGRQATGSVEDDLVQLYKGGSLVGTNMGSAVLWDSALELITYGGPTELWGTSWTPEEINDDGFGIGISITGSGTGTIDRVSIKVYFSEAGAGNHNRYGDQWVVEFFGTSSIGRMHAAGQWSGGMPGGTRGPERILTASPQQLWGSMFPYWGFASAGRIPSIDWLGVNNNDGASASVTNARLVLNPLVYPRFAWSEDDGATWTWISSTGEEDSPVIGADVGNSDDQGTIFLDNNAAMDRFEHNLALAPVSSVAYRMPFYYLTYIGEGGTNVIAANLYARFRPFSGYPKEAHASSSAFRAYVASQDGSVRRVGNYSGNGLAIQRYTMPRDPTGNIWTDEVFNDMMLRVGFNTNMWSNAFAWGSLQSNGAALYAMTWELLIPAESDPPPRPCAGGIDLSKVRFRAFQTDLEEE